MRPSDPGSDCSTRRAAGWALRGSAGVSVGAAKRTLSTRRCSTAHARGTARTDRAGDAVRSGLARAQVGDSVLQFGPAVRCGSGRAQGVFDFAPGAELERSQRRAADWTGRLGGPLPPRVPTAAAGRRPVLTPSPGGPSPRIGGRRGQAVIRPSHLVVVTESAAVMTTPEQVTIHAETAAVTTRSRDGSLAAGHTGVGQLCVVTGVSVVPTGMIGTDRIQPPGAHVPRWFRPAVIRFGARSIQPGYRGTGPRMPAADDQRCDAGDR